jgi:hypothetical protein
MASLPVALESSRPCCILLRFGAIGGAIWQARATQLIMIFKDFPWLFR